MTLRNLVQFVLVVSLSGIGSQVFAYDASPNIGTAEGSCADVIFSAFTPAPYSYEKGNEAAPNSEFSFLASKATRIDSLKVTVKDEKVPIKITPQGNGYLVKGKLPASATGSYVRVDIYAEGLTLCQRADGWLLKVGK
ncbi:MAG: hypothetical protein IPP12_20135 [Nitrospira sp.]|nr:hypothetical protein [Nitrospira sp.]MBK9949466.1 hypothetical protein [Nitrospira sp.]MBL8052780.1 hypothetical protein [Nitrospira sp.]OYT20139.1 MAG: hypothetical protein CCU26_07985 [Nitrospira sp. UW-LDO-01]